MTNVFYFGIEEFCPEIQPFQNGEHLLKRVLFLGEEITFVKSDENITDKEDKKLIKKSVELEVCFTNIYCSDRTIYLIDYQNELWGFGYSNHRLLGYDIQNVKNPVNLSKLFKAKFLHVSGGTNHAVAFTATKKLFGWGDITNSRLGYINESEKKILRMFQELDQGDQEQGELFFVPVYDLTRQILNRQNKGTKQIHLNMESESTSRQEQPKNSTGRRQTNSQVVKPSSYSAQANHTIEIVGLACAYDRSYLIQYDKVYYSGNSTYKLKAQSYLVRELQNQQILGIACGMYHTLAWNSIGQVYTWGESKDGQLGYLLYNKKDVQNSERTIQETPKLLDKLQELSIIQCAAGANYSMALDLRGHIYEWGKGPASFKLDLLYAIDPKRIAPENNQEQTFMKICSGAYHFAALDISGHLYTWGANFNGCLCMVGEDSRIPKLVNALSSLKILDIALGGYFTVAVASQNLKYRLKNVNLEKFKKLQNQRVNQEVSLIKDYSRRKNKAMDESSSLPNFSQISSLKLNTKTDQSMGYDGYDSIQRDSMIIPEQDNENDNVPYKRKPPSLHQQKLFRENSMKLITNSINEMLLPKLDLSKQKGSRISENGLQSSLSDQLPTVQSHPHNLVHKNDKQIGRNIYASFSQLQRRRDLDTFATETNQSMIKKYTKDIIFDDLYDNGKQTASVMYDKTVQYVCEMQSRAPLYLSVNGGKQQNIGIGMESSLKVVGNEEKEIDELITSENDLLKYQYIQMVKQGNEQDHMIYLLSESSLNAEDKFELYKSRQKQKQSLKNLKAVQDEKNEKIDQQVINIQYFNKYIKFNKMDMKQIEQMKQEIKKLVKKGEKVVQMEKREISIKSPSKIHFISKEEMKQQLLVQKMQREEITMRVQQKRAIQFRIKLENLQNEQKLKSLSYRQQQKQLKEKLAQNKKIIQKFLVALNMEVLLKLIQGLSSFGLEQKRLLFKEHMKARIIQNSFRKHSIQKKIKERITANQKRIFGNLIFTFRIKHKIKYKNVACRKIYLYFQRQQLIKMFRSKLQILLHSIENIQKFGKYYNKVIAVYMSQLNQKWDQHILSQFKINQNFLQEIKDQENQIANEGFVENETSQQIVKLKEKLMSKIYPINKIYSEMKLRPQMMLHTYELKYSILKRIEESSSKYQNIDEEKEQINTKYQQLNDILLPYSKHSNLIELQITLRIKFDQQQPLNISDKLQLSELKTKYAVLREYLREMRRQFHFSIRDYYEQLMQFKLKYNSEINTERVKLMFKTKVEDLKILAKQEEQEFKLLQLKREAAKKKKSKFWINFFFFTKDADGDFKQKANVFAIFKEFQQDHLPFGSLTLRITEHMYNQKPRFKVKLSVDQFKKLFTKYHQAFKVKYEDILTRARLQAQNQARMQKISRKSVSPDQQQ